jgi:hypothetical protein
MIRMVTFSGVLFVLLDRILHSKNVVGFISVIAICRQHIINEGSVTSDGYLEKHH